MTNAIKQQGVMMTEDEMTKENKILFNYIDSLLEKRTEEIARSADCNLAVNFCRESSSYFASLFSMITIEYMECLDLSKKERKQFFLHMINEFPLLKEIQEELKNNEN